MTITNISRVTENAGETPVITYSNRVTTIIRQPLPEPVITRVFTNVSGCCPCGCVWWNACGCNCNDCCGCCG